jgi:hypothetical protein
LPGSGSMAGGDILRSTARVRTWSPGRSSVATQRVRRRQAEPLPQPRGIFGETAWRNDRALRSRALNDVAGAFEARRENLVQVLSIENGKIVRDAAFEVSSADADGALTRPLSSPTWCARAGGQTRYLCKPICVSGISVPCRAPRRSRRRSRCSMGQFCMMGGQLQPNVQSTVTLPRALSRTASSPSSSLDTKYSAIPRT